MSIRVGLPKDLVREVDALVGNSKKSEFVIDAVQEKLRKEALLKALENNAWALSQESHPEWATSECVAAWARRRTTHA